MVEHGTFLVPTTYLADGMDVSHAAPELQAKAAEVFPQARAMLSKAIEAGVKIACGTDAPAIPHGENAKELWAMVDRGMTPLQALSAATVVSAELIDVDDRGRLEAGLPRRHHRRARRPARGHHDDAGRAVRDEGRTRLQARLTEARTGGSRAGTVTPSESGFSHGRNELSAGRERAEWRQRAVSRSLTAARSRAEQRIQRFLDAAFELIDEKGTTEFTIQEVIDRSKQSLRGFYQYFDGKDELLLALFEETVRESIEDYEVASRKVDPLERLRTFVIRLHEWCDPSERKRGTHNRVPITEFSTQLAVGPCRPGDRDLADLGDDVPARRGGRRRRGDQGRRHPPRRHHGPADGDVQLVREPHRRNPRLKVDSEHIWAFCLHGLGG